MSAVRRWAEPGPGPRDQSGFTLLELVIVIALVCLLFLTAWWRLMPLRGSAEAAHVATTVGTLRSALGLHVAERIVNDSPAAVAELDGSNPMKLLQQRPGNYLGEFPSAGPRIAAGSWFFETRTGRLGYRLRFPQYLVGTPPEPVDLYWRIRVRFNDRNDNGVLDAGTDSVRAVELETLHAERWQTLDAPETRTSPQE